MGASGGDGQAVTDKATVDGVELPVGQGEACIGVARVGLLVNEGEAHEGAAEVVLLVDEGEACGGAAEVVLLVNDNGGEACGGAAEVGLPVDVGEARMMMEQPMMGKKTKQQTPFAIHLTNGRKRRSIKKRHLPLLLHYQILDRVNQ